MTCMQSRHWFIMPLMVAVLGCEAQPRPDVAADAAVVVDPSLSQGYSLLHHLMSQQANVDKILILKSASDPVKTLVRAIAAESAQARDRLAELMRGDGQLKLGDTGLPALEQAARDRIEGATARSLLTSGGAAFQTRLLMTQQSATEYAAALAHSLAAREQQPQRREQLQQMAARFDELHTQVVALLVK
jgi:hypothetical protein